MADDRIFALDDYTGAPSGIVRGALRRAARSDLELLSVHDADALRSLALRAEQLLCCRRSTALATLEDAVDSMGWPEINAFNAELARGQAVLEDAGGYWLRAIRRLFGLSSGRDVVTTYRDAARALVREAQRRDDGDGSGFDPEATQALR